ncbi:hypothetical protein [Chryseobacterium sp. CT-SW4]|uniref:hypothetical protein n=1 Tax=Chryseobacterium sp. SW-1 TaxID=3157343 RepID=UPI003B02A4EA
MNNKIKILIASFFVCGLSFFNTLKAQTSNTIQEVQVNKNDAFNEIRNLLMANFDFTNSDYKQGTVNSEVRLK